ncbi:uncharacterized protein [Montipora capricornis]|uniref:uncharacterized protein isoform X3 n=1 Tax=Montipora capricornis TaxID=246305 RepID=UPI0035F1DE14
MASVSQEYQGHNQADGSGKVKVTILASEWGSSKGGLSTINRKLAIHLAKFSEVEITFFVPQCSEGDKKEALGHNINIVEAKKFIAYEDLELLSFPPDDPQIEVVIGHGVKLGRQAQVIRERHKCKWVQVVHTDPEELGMFKSYPDPISKGEEKHNIEVKLCEKADFVVAIGPKLAESFHRYLQSCEQHHTIFDFTPGIFEEFLTVKQDPDERKHCSVLVFGRGDAEDFQLKGFDIAGKAVASLADTHLVFVGAADGEYQEIKQSFLECDLQASCLKVRGYVKCRERLMELFCEVDLVVMPSRTDGFGLTGLEALSAGLPVLVSKNSGFGESLSKLPFGSSFVIDSEKPEVWAAAIKNIWDKEKQSRLVEVQILRSSYERKYSWTKQSDALLVKIINLVRGINANEIRQRSKPQQLPPVRKYKKSKTKEKDKKVSGTPACREERSKCAFGVYPVEPGEKDREDIELDSSSGEDLDDDQVEHASSNTVQKKGINAKEIRQRSKPQQLPGTPACREERSLCAFGGNRNGPLPWISSGHEISQEGEQERSLCAFGVYPVEPGEKDREDIELDSSSGEDLDDDQVEHASSNTVQKKGINAKEIRQRSKPQQLPGTPACREERSLCAFGVYPVEPGEKDREDIELDSSSGEDLDDDQVEHASSNTVQKKGINAKEIRQRSKPQQLPGTPACREERSLCAFGVYPVEPGEKDREDIELDSSSGEDLDDDQVEHVSSNTVQKKVKEGNPPNDVLEELSQAIGEKWKPLARRLKFTETDITRFHKQNEEYSEKPYKMLLEWKQREGSQSATYKVLFDALCHHLVGRQDLAEKFCCC